MGASDLGFESSKESFFQPEQDSEENEPRQDYPSSERQEPDPDPGVAEEAQPELVPDVQDVEDVQDVQDVQDGTPEAPAREKSDTVPEELAEAQAALEGLEAAAEPAPADEQPRADLRSLPQGKTLSLVNQKGGVGKTTSTINLGAALVEEGAKVLLVDFDPQGALSVGLGIDPGAVETSIYNLILDRQTTFSEVVMPTRIEGMDLLPANIDLSAAEVQLVSEVAREQALLRGLEEARSRYNYILIDCPPSLGLLTVNALTASEGVIIPLECEYFALRGMALLMDTIAKVQERLNPQLRVEGILATMLDKRTIHGREVLARVTDAFGDKLFKTVIHKTIKFAEAPVAGESILSYASKSNGAQEYRDLAREVMTR